MKKLVHIFSFILFAALSAVTVSCERTAEIKFPEYRSVLVMHGYMAVGDSFKIALGKTLRSDVPVIDTNTYVNDGVVLLYENNIFRDTLKLNPVEKRYVSRSMTAAAGKVYRVVASAPGFLPVEATAIAPTPAPTVSVTRIPNTRVDNNGSPVDDIRIRFADPAAERNFYLLEASSPMGLFCIYTNDPAVERFSEDFLPVDFSVCLGDRIILADQSFNGTQKELVISGLSSLMRSFTSADGTVYKPYIKRLSVSEDYYKYYKTARSSGGDGLTLTNPIVVKGNVRNGYGLFTVYSVVTDSIQ